MFAWIRNARRRRILSEPFPPAWEAILREDVTVVHGLSADEHRTLQQLVQVFIAEKHFEGCGGLELSERMRVVIAAQACLLILNIDHDLYRDFQSILVYPSTMWAPVKSRVATIAIDDETAILGQAFHRGPVILAWDAARDGAYDDRDGQNLVFHEFAHKLDMMTGDANGAPPLASASQEKKWAAVFRAAFDHHVALHDAQHPTVLGDYALTDAAEFFAVATEHFFERPHQLLHAYADLYDVMRDFYQQDPAARMKG